MREHELVADSEQDAEHRPRLSAWLPLGLALAWLAIVSTQVHDTPSLVFTWFAGLGVAAIGRGLRTQRPALTPPEVVENAVAQPATATGPATGDVFKSNVLSPLASQEGKSPAPPHASPVSPNSVPETPIEARVGWDPSAVQPGTQPPRALGEAGRSGVAPVPIDVLTAQEVAELLGADRDDVVSAIVRGDLPGNGFGNQWWVLRPSLIRWLGGRYPVDGSLDS
jgi:hypothetical protein